MYASCGAAALTGRPRQLGGLREPVVDERGEVLARAAHRHVELARDVVGGRLPAPAQRVEHRAPALGQRGRNPFVGHRVRLREQQVAVAELVPQVTTGVRLGVGPLERGPARRSPRA